MESWLQMALTIIGSVLASSGFWAFIQSKRKKKDGSTELLIGLAHDRIIFLGMSYVRRTWITQDEYDNLVRYLYKPYKELGGNGTAARVMAEVEKLPIRDTLSLVLDEVEEEKKNRHEQDVDFRMAEGGHYSST